MNISQPGTAQNGKPENATILKGANGPELL